MKANLPQNEPKMIDGWRQSKLYEKIRAARAGAPQYVLHDGPPYANGAIHLGHALNKSLKDFIVKSKTMAGFDSPYVPGWDCHGLPIEIKVDDKLGRKKLEMDPLTVRAECFKYAMKHVGIQAGQFERIGVFADYEHPYLTLNKEYESNVLDNFYAFFEKGLVYKGLKPVYWCLHCRTALAEAEVEYANHTSPSVYVRYALTSDAASIAASLAGKKLATIIWTTTPWTLPASMAVTFNAVEEYVALDCGEWVYLVAGKLLDEVKANCGLAGDVIARFEGRKLEHATFAHPFLDRSILGCLADYVTMDTGTGAVHTAPAHGMDDFITGSRYGIDATCHVDEGGHLRDGLPEYDGKRVWEANPLVVELLKSRGVLLGAKDLEHSYPHCWRCHKPVIFRATEQWFISMDTAFEGGTLRSKALEQIQQVKWDPAWGEGRIANMVATRPDWCISRQRLWGVPIAVFFCESCQKPLNDRAVNQRIVELVAKEGSDVWYRLKAEELLPSGTKCSCGGDHFRKEMDIIDVWFESGSSQNAVLGHNELPWPADLYLEGGDQYRGWFHSSMLCAVGKRGLTPYHAVATNGWTLDENGKAMSKSLGNVVDPVDIAKRLGGEIVRLWVASVDFREDVKASENLMQRVADNYRKIRNTFRYILGNLHGFDSAKDAVAFDEMEPIDRFMLMKTAGVATEIRGWYDEMLFHRIYQRLNEFAATDLSAQYFDILKDRLYTSPRSSRERHSAQTALWRIGEALVRLVAPIMSFTADEVWQFLPQVDGRPASVHLALFPAEVEITGGITDTEKAAQGLQDWQKLFTIRNEALKALEGLRKDQIIKANLEAKVTITAEGEIYEMLQRHQSSLASILVVSQVELKQGPAGEAEILAEATHAEGAKCDRCWNYSTHVGEDAAYPTVCERCSAAIKIIEAEAGA